MNAADGSNTHVELQSSENLNGAANNNTALMLKGRTLIRGLVKPVNASLTFGGAVIGVLDFLSPRIALLPIAATVAVVVLIGTVLLRKFFAPHLPDGSTLKTLFAPQASMHRSPVIVAGGVLSALMVAGAAWSSAAAPSGGIIASKFDAARNAQMQLGVLQVMQKEQRGQTAVMEDIREGRAANSRRELANQGILWQQSKFEDAVGQRDLQVIALFLAGGMQWRVERVEYLLVKNDIEIVNLLLRYPKLATKHSGDCIGVIRGLERGAVSDKSTYARGVRSNDFVAVELNALSARFLKAACADPEDITRVQEALIDLAKSEIGAIEDLEVLKDKAKKNDCIEVFAGGPSNPFDVKLCGVKDKELALRRQGNYVLLKQTEIKFLKNVLSVIS